jgi:crossover junction endodeoxyribonuclease RusA
MTGWTSIRFPDPAARMSLNDRHGTWRARHALTAAWRHATARHAVSIRHATHIPMAGSWSPRPMLVQVGFEVHDQRRRDPHNLVPTVKPIVDGLVDAGLVPDDTPEWVSVLEPLLAVDPFVGTSKPRRAPASTLVMVRLRPDELDPKRLLAGLGVAEGIGS